MDHRANKIKNESLISAVQSGQAEIVEMLLAEGADVNQADQRGDTALMLAVEGKHAEIVDVLLARGVNVNQVDKNGNTILMDFAWCGRDEVVELLLARGANVNQVGRDGVTALLAAAGGGHTKTMEILLEWGADPNQVTQSSATLLGHLSGMNALMCLVSNPFAQEVVTETLVSHFDLTQIDKAGNTALMWAVGSRYKSAVVSILLHEEDITDNNGITLFQRAIDLGYPEVVVDLLLKGVSFQDFPLTDQDIEASREADLIRSVKEFWQRSTSYIGITTEQEMLQLVPLVNQDRTMRMIAQFGLNKLCQIIWKEVAGQSLFSQELTYLRHSRKHTELKEFIDKFLKEKSEKTAWKYAIRHELSVQKSQFLKTNAYYKDSTIEYLKIRAIKITKKVFQGIRISYQESKFLDNPEFYDYDFTLSRAFYNSAALTSMAISDTFLPEAMQRVIEFLPKQEAFRLQSLLLNIGMKKLLKQSYKIKIGEEQRHLSDEELRMDGFTSNKILQLYKLIMKYNDIVINFNQGEIINLEILLAKYQSIKDAESIAVSGCEESKECHESKQNAQPENIHTVYGLYDIQYDNSLLNDPNLVSEAVRSGTLNSLLTKASENKLEVVSETQEKPDAEQEALDVSQFFSAIDRSDLAAVQYLVSIQPSLVNATNAGSNSALTMAVLYGHNEIASYLIDSGAYVPQYVPAEEKFDLDTLSLNLGDVGNIDQERESLQFQQSFDEYNALYAVGLLCWLIGRDIHSHA